MFENCQLSQFPASHLNLTHHHHQRVRALCYDTIVYSMLLILLIISIARTNQFPSVSCPLSSPPSRLVCPLTSAAPCLVSSLSKCPQLQHHDAPLLFTNLHSPVKQLCILFVCHFWPSRMVTTGTGIVPQNSCSCPRHP